MGRDEFRRRWSKAFGTRRSCWESSRRPSQNRSRTSSAPVSQAVHTVHLRDCGMGNCCSTRPPSEGVPPGEGGGKLSRQSTIELTQVLCTHLTEEVGITHRNSVEAYAAALFDAGYDSPAAFAQVSTEELEHTFGWRMGHVRQVQTFRRARPLE